MRVTIYVQLMEEGTEAWRPVAAEQAGERFLILGAVPEEEIWEFQPGTKVFCRRKRFQGDTEDSLVAYRVADEPATH
jgi:hypothetical protein